MVPILDMRAGQMAGYVDPAELLVELKKAASPLSASQIRAILSVLYMWVGTVLQREGDMESVLLLDELISWMAVMVGNDNRDFLVAADTLRYQLDLRRRHINARRSAKKEPHHCLAVLGELKEGPLSVKNLATAIGSTHRFANAAILALEQRGRVTCHRARGELIVQLV